MWVRPYQEKIRGTQLRTWESPNQPKLTPSLRLPVYRLSSRRVLHLVPLVTENINDSMVAKKVT